MALYKSKYGTFVSSSEYTEVNTNECRSYIPRS